MFWFCFFGRIEMMYALVVLFAFFMTCINVYGATEYDNTCRSYIVDHGKKQCLLLTVVDDESPHEMIDPDTGRVYQIVELLPEEPDESLSIE